MPWLSSPLMQGVNQSHAVGVRPETLQRKNGR